MFLKTKCEVVKHILWMKNVKSWIKNIEQKKKGNDLHVYQIAKKLYDDVVKCLFLFVSVCVYKTLYKNDELYIVLHTLITV